MAAAGGVNSRIRQAKSAFRVTHQISRHLMFSHLRGNNPLADFAMDSFLALIGLAVVVFVSTNIDDVFVLIGFFADKNYRARDVVVGQYVYARYT